MSVSKKVKIENKDGIHARPSAMLVECASKFKCDVILRKDDQEGDAKNILDLMTLAMAYNQEVEVECCGEDENDALLQVSSLLETEFNFERKQ
jgi:phosphocarrier protein